MTVETDNVKPVIRAFDTVGAASIGDRVSSLAQKMNSSECECVAVRDANGKVVGIISRSDLAKAQSSRSTASELLGKTTVSCIQDTLLSEAESLMYAEKQRHLLVVDGDGTAVGIVWLEDMLTYRARASANREAILEELLKLAKVSTSLEYEKFLARAVRHISIMLGAGSGMLRVPAIGKKRGNHPCTSLYGCCKCKECPSSPESDQPDCEAASKGDKTESDQLRVPLTIRSGKSDSDAEEEGWLCLCEFCELTEADRQLLFCKAEMVSNFLGDVLSNSVIHAEALSCSYTDALTGVGSRVFLEEALEREYARAVRYGHPFALAMVDLDRLKRVNDTSGHAMGDEVLRALGRLMLKEIRVSDTVARYGGDEFVLLMPETCLEDAVCVIERVRAAVEKLDVCPDKITISCGVAELDLANMSNGWELLTVADSALYRAKAMGRNCVVSNDAIAVTK